MHSHQGHPFKKEHNTDREPSAPTLISANTASANIQLADVTPNPTTSSAVSGEAFAATEVDHISPVHRSEPLHSGAEAPHVPPNGGLHAYLKVLGGFLVFFITIGIISTFGSYQAYYESELLSSYSASAISWIGSTQIFLGGLVSTLAGAFYDRGHVRLLLSSGMLLIVLGLMMLSIASRFWQIFLSQGCCIGIGTGLIYVPAVSIVSNQFTTKRTVVLGVIATGSPVGGVILPIMFRQLLPILGWGWTNRILGFLILALSLLTFALLVGIHWPNKSQAHRYLCLVRHTSHQEVYHQSRQPHVHTNTAGRFIALKQVLSLFTTLHARSYLFLCIGLFFVNLGYWVPLFYIVPFASFSLGTSQTYATYLLAILNGASFFGRILPPFLSQVIGSALVLFMGALSLGAVVSGWVGIRDIPSITVWCVLVGFFSGIVVSLPNAVVARISDPSNVGLRIGVMWTVSSFAELIGTPLAGALVKQRSRDERDVDYRGAQIFGGLSILLGATLLLVPALALFKDDKFKGGRRT